jgi:hypothetical protein
MPLNTDTLPNFEKARLALGNGDLMDVYNFDTEYKDDSKLVHTLRKHGAGFVQGTIEFTGSFDTYIHPGGVEADWWAAVQLRSVNQLRFKLSGGITLAVDCKITSTKLKQAVDSAQEVNVSFIGKLSL